MTANRVLIANVLIAFVLSPKSSPESVGRCELVEPRLVKKLSRPLDSAKNELSSIRRSWREVKYLEQAISWQCMEPPGQVLAFMSTPKDSVQLREYVDRLEPDSR